MKLPKKKKISRPSTLKSNKDNSQLIVLIGNTLSLLRMAKVMNKTMDRLKMNFRTSTSK